MLATPEEFEEIINDALDELPESFARAMDNLVVLARDFNPDDPTMLGLFEGVPRTEQHANHTGYLPEAIFIYKDAHEAVCGSVEELREQVRITVFHEVGHYFGIDEEGLHALGWG
ncbi:metallopeptidase family protein [Corynebacterium liangguodongii]|uniref:Uncharacterized protein n=1 Tax=Corynebacterium liangguodongii TaxID=2079535 RepID=A0A2S0WGF4_9CORY|nr:metallopeptidase family protein [Corynebacterium liangguodongii]AWB84857.1 hypothetical protein C3E79_10565 [Corynebacterium liangguodongii]PWB99214.1 hypothetical protein DF219_08180 [Corynebacterium liangguodongii]